MVVSALQWFIKAVFRGSVGVLYYLDSGISFSGKLEYFKSASS